jgi:long-chain acyl-CoA synthetase
MPINHDTSFIDSMPANVAVQFLDRVRTSPDREAFRYPVGEAWESVTWQQTGDRVQRVAAGLMSLGIEPEQRVGIAAGTRFEWILADLAIMCAGAATTTVYPSTNAEDVTYILSDSECRVVFAEDDEQIKKLTDHKGELPHLEKVVTFTGQADGDWVISLDDLEQAGAAYLEEHDYNLTVVCDKVNAVTAPGDLRSVRIVRTSAATLYGEEIQGCAGNGTR